MRKVRTRVLAAACLPILAAALTACDIVTADFKSQESAEWRRSYELEPGARVEISNLNGKIDVTATDGDTLEVVGLKVAKGGSPDAARQMLDRIEIVESASSEVVKIETRLPRGGGFFNMGGGEVRYTVNVPAAAAVRVKTINGGIELRGVKGSVAAETTNGGITAREIAGTLDASTTNGGIDAEVTQVTDEGVKLRCTNGGIKLRLPSDARATVSARITNGGIDASGLNLETIESTRRRLEARLNGGGPMIRIEGTNGGIRLGTR